MPRLSKQESEELNRHIEEIEKYASENGRLLTGPAEYENISLKLHQQNGTIPADLDKSSVYKIPEYKRLIKRVYDKADHILKARPKPPRVIRYKSHHVRLGHRETCISLHAVMEIMLSLRLDQRPGTPGARKAVRAWMQARLDQHEGQLSSLSHWLQGEIIREIAATDLKSKYDEWLQEG